LYFLGMWSGGQWWWCICVWCSSCRVVFWICQWWPRMVCQPTEAFGVLEYLCAGRRLSQFFFWVQHSLRYRHNYTFQRGSYGIFVGAAHHFCTTQMENPASHTAPPPLHVWLDFLYHVTWYQLSFLSVLLHL
jgi:hypothetical protein